MASDLQAVVQELGGVHVFRPKPRTEAELREAIRGGLRHQAVREVMRSTGLTLKELAASLDLSPRSLQRRRGEGRLARYESDRLYRLARIVVLAKRHLGEEERAARWLRRANRALGGSTPLELVDTELGARTVENVLGRIAHGGIS